MRQLAKAILIVAAVAVFVVAVATLCVNLYVQSTGVQARIAQGLSDAFHLQVKLQGASFTPWGGLHLTGIDVPQPDPANAGSFLQTSEVSAQIRIFPLLGHRLVIRQLSINDPKVVWIQNPQGNWTLPEAVPQVSPPPQAAAAASAPSAAPAPPASAPETAAAPGPPASPPPPPFTVTIGRFRLKRASFQFLDSTGKTVASFSDITLDCPNPTDALVRGTVHSKEGMLGDVVLLDGVRTNFAYDDGHLSLSDFEAGIGQGHIRGTFDMQTNEPGSPFSVGAKFDGIELATVIPKSRNNVIDASGILDGFVNASGSAEDVESITGVGQVVLSRGRVRYELFEMLGDFLRLPELSELELSQARLDYHLAEGKAQVDQIVLQSPNLKVTAHGTIQLEDGRLNLEARLGVDRILSDRLPSLIKDNFVSNAGSGYAYRDFGIHGTVASPKTDLVQRDLGKRIERQLTNALFSFFGNRKPVEKRVTPPPPPTSQPPAASAPPAPVSASPSPTPMVPAIAATPTPLPSPAASP